MRAAVAVLAVALVALLVACDAAVGEPPLLLLPEDGGDLPAVSRPVLEDAVGEDLAARLPDVRSAALLTTGLPDAEPEDCRADWRAAPDEQPVLALPGVGYTQVRSGPLADGGRQVLVCDHGPDGRLLRADDLQLTGTDQPVGEDYAVRAGAVLGRVDVGVPEGAAVALRTFDTWTLLIPLDPQVRVLRLHALAGGDAAAGYDVGGLRFLDARGRDITPASAPVPDVVHGVPRDRGSGTHRGPGGHGG
jgi:hypothetical protein